MQKTLGGERLGSGKKMKVNLRGYERSTHDMGYIWRSTMAAGTLVPFMSEVALPGDTFDINLDVDLKTHPTIGPLFGSYKVQLDVFLAPLRLYMAKLNNDELNVGLDMKTVAFPQMTLFADPAADIDGSDPDNAQINPSCILSYLGIRGVGIVDPLEPTLVPRTFNAVPLLMYWDVYKNYYANKQETWGYCIHTVIPTYTQDITGVEIGGIDVDQNPAYGNLVITANATVVITKTTPDFDPQMIIFYTSKGILSGDGVLYNRVDGPGTITMTWSWDRTGNVTINSWDYFNNGVIPIAPPRPQIFELSQIDQMRKQILADVNNAGAFDVNDADLEPYSNLLNWNNNNSVYLNTQEGLGLKCYQSDLFNNWLSTEWIDGPGGINEITTIDTTDGLKIDTFTLSKKVWDMLNRIAVSGGSYNDWVEAQYDHQPYRRATTPMYMGGLIRELVFQEVVSNAASETQDASQPIGTLAGKGVMAGKKKGGRVTIKVDEPGWLMGIISLTPRIDYSQGNKWDIHLQTMADLHVPALDEIGFQDLIQEQMAWFTTAKTLGGDSWVQKSAGKQPAWLNYMTNVNQTRGNFAVGENEMFMTLNRRYKKTLNQSTIADLTTYIDPSKFNFSFAETSLDAQNFWAQIAVDIEARRKMSAKIMPNL